MRPGSIFQLPPKGAFKQGGPDDPLPYYYHPLTARLYSRRIDIGLSLLTPPYGSILDVGYGSGLLLPTLSRLCSELFAVDRDTDPAPVSRALAELGIYAALVKGDIATVGLEEERFDLVVAFSVFEEVADPLSALTAVCRTLKPGGELLIGMPRVDRIMELLFRLIGYRGIEGEHVRTYVDFMKMACEGSGLDLERFATLPRFVPRFAALYYAMLFRKNRR